MCFLRKKKNKTPIQRIESKFQYGEHVRFRYKGEICPGTVFGVSKNLSGEVVYLIQIGGECPAIISNVKEADVIPYKKPQY